MITYVLSGLLVVLGVVIVIQTLAAGVGGGLGLLIGSLFILAGGARMNLQRQRG